MLFANFMGDACLAVFLFFTFLGFACRIMLKQALKQDTNGVIRGKVKSGAARVLLEVLKGLRK